MFRGYAGCCSYVVDIDLKKLLEDKDTPGKEKKKFVKKTFQDR